MRLRVLFSIATAAAAPILLPRDRTIFVTNNPYPTKYITPDKPPPVTVTGEAQTVWVNKQGDQVDAPQGAPAKITHYVTAGQENAAPAAPAPAPTEAAPPANEAPPDKGPNTVYVTQSTLTVGTTAYYDPNTGTPANPVETKTGPAPDSPTTEPIKSSEAPPPEPQPTTEQQESQDTQPPSSPEPTPETTQQPEPSSQPEPEPTTEETTSQQPEPSSSSAPEPTGYLKPPTWIVYSPYNDDQSCKSDDQVKSDLGYLKAKGINKVRIYGSDCGAFDTIAPACKELGLKINQGFWFPPGQGSDSIDDGVKELVDYASNNGWDLFEFITVGNEAVNDKTVSPSELVNKLNSVRSQLRGAGYQGSVITSEPPISFIRHPELCGATDFIGTNIHSYFNQGIDADGAGDYLNSQNEEVAKACPNKGIFITETGYPHKGNVNGANRPSKQFQKQVYESIWSKVGNDVTVLAVWDDMWKNPGPYNIEQYFGAIDLF
ncbi:probable family 17 glucosidase Scw11p [Diutina catenulata]